ncbi:Nuclease [Aquirufa nivalisilvae]|jgi:endonuclease G|uniref:Nuclease n=1 Tax=Aquirufa nivalisilvae TaxID=2516557 RepID=A0A2S2DW99_9BACT|nr:DNA/RNA non-specific endonuclease [Aquirufa nivalisilvae]AWL09067.1 Nuclease [Aquirufa nivalisilvae]
MLLSILLYLQVALLPGGIFNISGASTASTTNYLQVKKGYVMSYDGVQGKANWVAWTLTASDIGEVPRSNRFRQDEDLPRLFKRIEADDYKHSGYDRGHLCNSEDRSSSSFLNAETFQMSNMIPQTPELNRGPWERLEAYCRKLAKRGQKLTIYAGGLGVLDKIGNEVVIPKYCWKVVVSQEKTWYLLFPNSHELHPNWQTFATSKTNLEKMTGLRFP